MKRNLSIALSKRQMKQAMKKESEIVISNLKRSGITKWIEVEPYN